MSNLAKKYEEIIEIEAQIEELFELRRRNLDIACFFCNKEYKRIEHNIKKQNELVKKIICFRQEVLEWLSSEKFLGLLNNEEKDRLEKELDLYKNKTIINLDDCSAIFNQTSQFKDMILAVIKRHKPYLIRVLYPFDTPLRKSLFFNYWIYLGLIILVGGLVCGIYMFFVAILIPAFISIPWDVVWSFCQKHYWLLVFPAIPLIVGLGLYMGMKKEHRGASMYSEVRKKD